MQVLRFRLLSFLACCLFAAASISAQQLDPVKWSFEVTQDIDAETFTLVATATIQNKWAVYSQHTDPDGPVPTVFEINPDSHELLGNVEEISKPIAKYSELFEVETIKFKNKAVFHQTFKTSDPSPTITGVVTYMACDDQRCLPPRDVEFVASLPSN